MQAIDMEPLELVKHQANVTLEMQFYIFGRHPLGDTRFCCYFHHDRACRVWT